MAQLQFPPDAQVDIKLPIGAVSVILESLDELPRKRVQATFELIFNQLQAQSDALNAPPAVETPLPAIDPTDTVTNASTN